MAYLKSKGYEDADVKINNPEVTDRQRYFETRWRNGQEVEVKIDRYTVFQSLKIQAKGVENAEDEASQIRLGLISKRFDIGFVR